MSEIVKICKIHGPLEINQTRKDGNSFRCKECRIASNKNSYYANQEKRIATSTKWKQENRERANAWERADRAKNPEKYRAREKEYKSRNWAKLSVNESLRKLGLKNEDFLKLKEEHNGLCKICNNPETSLSRNGNVRRLAIDHCHSSGKIRGLLCHDCNTMLGKAKDNITILQSAIEYLQSHQHKEAE